MALTSPPVAETRSYWTLNRADTERAFQTARRHSLIVRVLRIALPAFIVIVGASIAISTYLSPLLTPLPANPGEVVVSGKKITMDKPHMAGFTRDGRAYEINAAAAIQDITAPDIIQLKTLNAKVEMQDHGELQLKAPAGVYDSKTGKLQLSRNIRISSSSGYRGRLKEASIDIRQHHMVSNKPVKIWMLGGVLKANRMEITDSGDLIRFDRGVDVTTKLNEPTGSKGESAATQQPEASPRSPKEQEALPARSRAAHSAIPRMPLPDPRRFGTRHFSTTIRRLIRLPRADPRYRREAGRGAIQ